MGEVAGEGDGKVQANGGVGGGKKGGKSAAGKKSGVSKAGKKGGKKAASKSNRGWKGGEVCGGLVETKQRVNAFLVSMCLHEATPRPVQPGQTLSLGSESR